MEADQNIDTITKFLFQLNTAVKALALNLKQFLATIGIISQKLYKTDFYTIFQRIHFDCFGLYATDDIFLALSKQSNFITIDELQQQLTIKEPDPMQFMIRTKQFQIQMKALTGQKAILELKQFFKLLKQPRKFLQEYDGDQNYKLCKAEFSKLLLDTKLPIFNDKDIKNATNSIIFEHFDRKKEIQIDQLLGYFGVLEQYPDLTPSSQMYPILQSVALKKKNYQNEDQLQTILNKRISYMEAQQKCIFPQALTKSLHGLPKLQEASAFNQLQHCLEHVIKYSDDSPKIDEKKYEYLSGVSFMKKFYPEKLKNNHLAQSSYKVCQLAASVFIRQSRVGIAKAIEPKDIQQGQLGDCYFLSSLAAIATIYPELIYDNLLFAQNNVANLLSAKLFVDGEWRTFITDDSFPFKKNYIQKIHDINKFTYARPHHNQVWVMLLEKCWAKVFGSYSAIDNGSVREAFIALTGAPCELHNGINLKTTKNKSIQQNRKNIVQILNKVKSNKYIASIDSSSQINDDDLISKGLLPYHSYSFIKIEENVGPKGTTLIKLRDPTSPKQPWKGDWSYNSPKWTAELRDRLHYNDNPEEGSFYISIDDFQKYFANITVCKINYQFRHTSLRVKSNNRKSVYFRMAVLVQGKYTLSIYKKNKRHFNQKDQRQNSYNLSNMRLIILKKEEGQNMKYIASAAEYSWKPTQTSKQVSSQVCSIDCQKLEVGEYILSAKIFWKLNGDEKEEHQFVLTSYGVEETILETISKTIDPGIAVKFKNDMIESYAQFCINSNSKLIKQKDYKNDQKYQFDVIISRVFSETYGLGFIKIQNNQDKKMQIIYTSKQKKIPIFNKVKMIKPDKLEQKEIFTMKVQLQPKSTKVYGFFILDLINAAKQSYISFKPKIKPLN